jgi:hypothetical protein
MAFDQFAIAKSARLTLVGFSAKNTAGGDLPPALRDRVPATTTITKASCRNLIYYLGCGSPLQNLTRRHIAATTDIGINVFYVWHVDIGEQ